MRSTDLSLRTHGNVFSVLTLTSGTVWVSPTIAKAEVQFRAAGPHQASSRGWARCLPARAGWRCRWICGCRPEDCYVMVSSVTNAPELAPLPSTSKSPVFSSVLLFECNGGDVFEA